MGDEWRAHRWPQTLCPEGHPGWRPTCTPRRTSGAWRPPRWCPRPGSAEEGEPHNVPSVQKVCSAPFLLTDPGTAAAYGLGHGTPAGGEWTESTTVATKSNCERHPEISLIFPLGSWFSQEKGGMGEDSSSRVKRYNTIPVPHLA